MSSLGCSIAVLLSIQVRDNVFDIIEALIPFVKGLDVDGPNSLVSLFPQVGHKRAANEAAGTPDDNQFVSQIHPVLHGKFAPAIQALPPSNSEELVRSELVRNL